MGFLIFITILFGSMGYSVYKIIIFFDPMFFIRISPYVQWFVWVASIAFLIGFGLQVLFGKEKED
jgi:hypothetical protein